MKKCLTLLLALALCLGLAVPALAAVPENAKEAAENFSFSSSLRNDGYKTQVDVSATLYMRDPGTGEMREPLTINSYQVAANDTVFTIANTGAANDFYITIRFTIYEKIDEERYACTYGEGYTLRETGEFEHRAAADKPMLKLQQGESATITGAQLSNFIKKKDSFIGLSIVQTFPEEDEDVTMSYIIKVDNDLTAQLVAEQDADKTSDTASWYSMATDMDKYNNVVKEPVNLYGEGYGENGYITAPEYRIVGEDTFYSIYNTSGKLDNFFFLTVTRFVKSGDKYVEDVTYIYTETGLIDLDKVTDSDEIFYLFTGSGTSFNHLPDSDKALDAYYRFTVYQMSLEGESLHYASELYRVDNEKAAELKSNPFTDVPADAYYHDAVLWALEKGITTGMTETTFGPAATCTRGQVATFLWRAKGSPEPVTKTNPFTDVKESDYFYKAVLWAYENGITTGTTATAFSPEATCTSGQVITFLWRANDKPAAETEGTEYYAQAVAWANANGLLAGTDVPFAPENQSPRADIVTYLYRDLAE